MIEDDVMDVYVESWIHDIEHEIEVAYQEVGLEVYFVCAHRLGYANRNAISVIVILGVYNCQAMIYGKESIFDKTWTVSVYNIETLSRGKISSATYVFDNMHLMFDYLLANIGDNV